MGRTRDDSAESHLTQTHHCHLPAKKTRTKKKPDQISKVRLRFTHKATARIHRKIQHSTSHDGTISTLHYPEKTKRDSKSPRTTPRHTESRADRSCSQNRTPPRPGWAVAGKRGGWGATLGQRIGAGLFRRISPRVRRARRRVRMWLCSSMLVAFGGSVLCAWFCCISPLFWFWIWLE